VLQFRQQKGTGKSIVDGFIAQDSIKIAVETKLTEAFDPQQLENHLAVFRAEQHKLLILLSPTLGDASTSQLALVRENARSRNIQVVHTSFEDIVQKTRSCLSEHDEEMLALVADYESFCSDLAFCPATSTRFSCHPAGNRLRQRAISTVLLPRDMESPQGKISRYLRSKDSSTIGQIVKRVVCAVDLDAGTVTAADGQATLTKEEQERILGATKEARAHDWDLTTGHRFYLCDIFQATDFRKTSREALWGTDISTLTKSSEANCHRISRPWRRCSANINGNDLTKIRGPSVKLYSVMTRCSQGNAALHLCSRTKRVLIRIVVPSVS